MLRLAQAHRLRVHGRRGQQAKFAPPELTARRSSSLPGRPARVPPAHHRGPAGREGQRARLRPQEQEGRSCGPRTSPTQVTEAGITRTSVASKFPGAVLEIAGQSFGTNGEADTHGPGGARPARQRLSRRRGHAATATRASRPGSMLNISGRRQELLGHLPRREGRRTCSAAAGGYETQWSNSVGEHSLLGQSAGSNGGAGCTDQLDRRRHRDQQQGSRDARPREGIAAVVERRRVLLGAGRRSPRRGNERGISMLPVRRRAGDRRVRERRPLLSLRHRLAVQRQGQAGQGAGAHRRLVRAQEPSRRGTSHTARRT